MKNIGRISQQTVWQIIGKVVTSLSTFIILAIVARNYGEEGTGTFTLALTYLAIFYLLADFGFNAHELKKYTVYSIQYTGNFQKLLGTRILWSVVLVVIALGTLPFWPFANDSFSRSVLFGSLAILGSGVYITCNLIFQGKLRYDLSVLASSTGTLVSLGVFIFFASNKYPIPFTLLAHLLGWIIIAAAALFLVRKIARNDYSGILPIYDIRYTINLLHSSWPIAATLALNVIYFRADSFMISYFRGNAEVGIYGIAYSVFQTVLVLPSFIMNSYYPLMLKSLKGMKVVAFALLGLAALGTLLTLVLSPVVVKLLTGGGFAGATESLQILSLGFPAYFLSALLMWLMVAKNHYKRMLLIYALGLIFNLVLNFILIPKYSFYGASWVTVVSEYLILGLQVIMVKVTSNK